MSEYIVIKKSLIEEKLRVAKNGSLWQVSIVLSDILKEAEDLHGFSKPENVCYINTENFPQQNDGC